MLSTPTSTRQTTLDPSVVNRLPQAATPPTPPVTAVPPVQARYITPQPAPQQPATTLVNPAQPEPVGVPPVPRQAPPTQPKPVEPPPPPVQPVSTPQMAPPPPEPQQSAPAPKQPPAREDKPVASAKTAAKPAQAQTESDQSEATAQEGYTTVAISHKSDKVVRTTSHPQLSATPSASTTRGPSQALKDYQDFAQLEEQLSKGLISLVSLLYKVNHNPELRDSIYRHLLEASAKASPLADDPQVEVAGKDYKHACQDPIYNPITVPVAQAKFDFLKQVAALFEPDSDDEAQSHLMEFNQVEDDEASDDKHQAADPTAKSESTKAKAAIGNLIYEIDGKNSVAASANKSLGKRTQWHKMSARYIREELLAKRIKQDSLLSIGELVPLKDLCINFFETRATLHDALASLYDDKSLNPNIPLDELERRVAKRFAHHKSE